MLAKAYTATPRGVGALFVTVEVDRIRAQMPSVTVVGLPDTAVREARERIFAAIRHLGRRAEAANVVINLAPADERKEGAALDLPMAVAFLAAAGELPVDRPATTGCCSASCPSRAGCSRCAACCRSFSPPATAASPR